MKTYAVYFKYTRPGEKKPGNITHVKIQASNIDEAKQIAIENLSPGVELIRVQPVG
jgi:hypothetical protein